MKNLIFVDVEATGDCPGIHKMTEFGAVDYATKQTFHGILFTSVPNKENPAISEIIGEGFDQVKVFTEFKEWIGTVCKGRPIFMSDNPAYDFQWINYGFWHAIGENPFGHSGRRISDFYAGLTDNFSNTQDWKKLRITPHDHNPVNDAMGNVEAFERMMKGER